MESSGAWAIFKKSLPQFKDLIRNQQVNLLLDNQAMCKSMEKILTEEEPVSDIDIYSIKILSLLKTVTRKIAVVQIPTEHQKADKASRLFEPEDTAETVSHESA